MEPEAATTEGARPTTAEGAGPVAGPSAYPGSSRPNVVAAFDFDGTLTSGGSMMAFLTSVCGRAPVTAAIAGGLPRLALAALAGGTRSDEAKETLLVRLLAGRPVAEIERIGAEFAARHVSRHLRPDTRARLEWHRSQGHRILIVSASPECYVRPAAELLGADAALATRLAQRDGLLTGRYDGKNCRGAEKHARVVNWIRAEGLGAAAPILWAYGNSRGDRFLLQAAEHGVDAGRLGRFGHLGAFPTLADVARVPAG